jgi:ribonuclease BN (tRNA processing enzyme)
MEPAGGKGRGAMKTDRRGVLGGFALAGLASATAQAQQPPAPTIPRKLGTGKGATLFTIGTKGGPRVGGRKNPANLLMIDGEPFVIDCGYGVADGLVRAGLGLERLSTIFISHHHSDHNLEYGNLIYCGWVSNLRRRLQCYGPVGLEQMTRDFWALNRIDIATRMADEGRVDPRTLVAAHDLSGSGPVMETGRVRVRALLTPHPPLKQAFAYRFDTPYGAVVFSGDTAANPGLADFARGADTLVHEVVLPAGVDELTKNVATDREAMKQHLLGAHTTPQEAGRIAARAGVSTLVLSHFVPGDIAWITDEMWRKAAAETFSGRIIVAHDGQEIPIGR